MPHKKNSLSLGPANANLACFTILARMRDPKVVPLTPHLGSLLGGGAQLKRDEIDFGFTQKRKCGLSGLSVQKYGGTSVQSVAHIERVAANVQETVRTGAKVIVVVSAMGEQTDELCRLAASLTTTPPRRELDMLLSSGERVTMSLLSMVFDKLSIKAISLTGSQSGILTDSNHGSARIKKLHAARIRSELERHQVIIVAGFQGVCPETKEVTTLGRGGSDLTAVALSIALGADSCDIYTDVAGVLTADPRRVGAAKTISNISWEGMRQLALCGASVVHPRAAALAYRKQMPLRVLSSADPRGAHTTIKGYRIKMEIEEALTEAITHRENQALVMFSCPKIPQSHSAFVQGLEWLQSHDETPLIYHEQKFGDHQYIEAVISGNNSAAFYEFMRQAVGARKLGAEMHTDLASLTLVGAGFLEYPKIMATLYENLSCEPLLVSNQDSAITVVLPMPELGPSLEGLHAAFFANR